MANALYDKGREGFLDGSIDWDTDTIRVFLVTSGYTVNLSTHEFISSVGTGVRAGNSGGTTRADAPALGTKTVTAGVADAANTTVTAVPGTVQYDYLVIFKDDGAADASSRLIAYIDSATNLPVTSNGGDITIAWDSGANAIFKL